MQEERRAVWPLDVRGPGYKGSTNGCRRLYPGLGERTCLRPHSSDRTRIQVPPFPNCTVSAILSVKGGGARPSLEGHRTEEESLSSSHGPGYVHSSGSPRAAGNIPGHSSLQEILAFPFVRKAQALIWVGLRNTPWGRDSS